MEFQPVARARLWRSVLVTLADRQTVWALQTVLVKLAVLFPVEPGVVEQRGRSL